MKITKKASATWTGNLKQGKGLISSESGVLMNTPYGFNTRFEGVRGTNPEELIGAAHSGCFTMALTMVLGEARLTAEKIITTAQVTLEEKSGGFEITSVHLHVKARVPNATEAQFQEMANKAKVNCPVSKLLKANITLEATLESSIEKKAG